MIFDKLFRPLYLEVFIGIVVYGTKTVVYVEVFEKSGIVKERIKKSFEGKDLNDEMRGFILSFIGKTPFYYISVLNDSFSQGIAKTCRDDELEKGSFYHVCHQNRWAFYVAKSDLESLRKNYLKVGTDFVFSPFAVMVEFFKEKTEEEMVLLTLVRENSLALCVFDRGELLYSDYVFVDTDEGYQKFLHIQKFIERFYEEVTCENRFINFVYMADTLNSGEDIEFYIMDELFLDVDLCSIDLNEEICKLAKGELDEL